MAQIQQRVLGPALALGLLLVQSVGAEKRFYPDDPLTKDPPPQPIKEAKSRKLNEYFDFFDNTFHQPGASRAPAVQVSGRGVNTLGEVPDSAWYTNRHGKRAMSLAELTRGPGDQKRPASNGQWIVTSAKAEGVTPGFVMMDSAQRKYYVKFDPMANPELATSADVVGSKFFYALGYEVPENYIVYFPREQLRIGPESKLRDNRGKTRAMTERDIDEILWGAPRDQNKHYRAVASLTLPGEPLGAFRFFGTRHDDPNDIVPHEHRRDLRGLFVFCAWLGHNDSKALNTLDTLIEANGKKYIQHSLIDFGAAFGSDSFSAKSPRAGYEYLFSWKPAAKNFFSLGLYVPGWQRANYPDIPSVGRFEAKMFDPDEWKPNYPNSAFDNRLPDDEFWAARQVMRFTDDEIRAIVQTGEYHDIRAADWLSRVLIERRDRVGRTFFAKVLPLDGFAVRNGRLEFEDLAVKHGFEQRRVYTVAWSRFDNEKQTATPIAGANRFELPAEALAAPAGSYLAAEIHLPTSARKLTVYTRKSGSGFEIVGIERTWN